jgi:LacI family transcriptional regulator
MRPTLQDIAEKAGVSTATVSRTLNNRPGVHPETRAEVLRIAQELGYVSSASAWPSASASTSALGFITYKREPQPISTYHHQLIEGIDHEARQYGYHAITIYVDGDMMDNALGLSIIREKRADGLILAGPALSLSFITQLYNSGIPIVLLDNRITNPAIDAVVCDNVGGTYSVTRVLTQVHHLQRLIFLSGPAHWFSSRERRQGYKRALEAIGQQPEVVYMPDTTVNASYAATADILQTYPDLEGIVAVNDATALGAIRSLKDHGRAVPDDIAVVGFDNVTWGSLNEPSLTTVRMFKQEMGIQAARRLIDVIERGVTTGFHLRLGTKLIIRRSCGCPEGEDEPFNVDFGS